MDTNRRDGHTKRCTENHGERQRRGESMRDIERSAKLQKARDRETERHAEKDLRRGGGGELQAGAVWQGFLIRQPQGGTRLQVLASRDRLDSSVAMEMVTRAPSSLPPALVSLLRSRAGPHCPPVARDTMTLGFTDNPEDPHWPFVIPGKLRSRGRGGTGLKSHKELRKS